MNANTRCAFRVSLPRQPLHSDRPSTIRPTRDEQKIVRSYLPECPLRSAVVMGMYFGWRPGLGTPMTLSLTTHQATKQWQIRLHTSACVAFRHTHREWMWPSSPRRGHDACSVVCQVTNGAWNEPERPHDAHGRDNASLYLFLYGLFSFLLLWVSIWIRCVHCFKKQIFHLYLHGGTSCRKCYNK